VNAVLHELIAASKQLCGDEDNGGGTITDLLILLLGEVDKNLASGILDIEETENGGTIVGYGDILSLVLVY
jgi:hypothetical protein